ncbi:MAG: hypothetical protein ABI200_06425, partial [Gaiellales bacterium]
MRILSILLTLMGIGMLIGAAVPTSSSIDLQANGDQVLSRITSYATTQGDDGPSYSPIYAYEVNGEVYKHTAVVSQ